MNQDDSMPSLLTVMKNSVALILFRHGGHLIKKRLPEDFRQPLSLSRDFSAA
jgi:hypothetical protein